jgi:hypothetical protein
MLKLPVYIRCYYCRQGFRPTLADHVGSTMVEGEEVPMWWCGCGEEARRDQGMNETILPFDTSKTTSDGCVLVVLRDNRGTTNGQICNIKGDQNYQAGELWVGSQMVFGVYRSRLAVSSSQGRWMEDKLFIEE